MFLRTFTPKVFSRSDFLELLRQLDSDQVKPKRQKKNRGVTVPDSLTKRIEDRSVSKALVM